MCSMALLNRGVRPESATLGYRNELDPRFPLTLPNRVRILRSCCMAVLFFLFPTHEAWSGRMV